MGFGLRCIDAVRETSLISTKYKEVIAKKVNMNDIPMLSEIHREHDQYYKDSPVFMPRAQKDPAEDLREWLNEENHHMWAAYNNEELIGYMRTEPHAETFISAHDTMMNITGAYVKGDKRKSGAGTVLLNSIQQWLIDNNYSLCGVDFEAINTLGSSFWIKYFLPYTYSLVRRIDERIL